MNGARAKKYSVSLWNRVGKGKTDWIVNDASIRSNHARIEMVQKTIMKR